MSSPYSPGIQYPTVSGILIVVAPAFIAFSIIAHRKSNSDLPASSGENSILFVYFLILFIAETAWSITSCFDILSFFFM